MAETAPLGLKVLCAVHAVSLLFAVPVVAAATTGRGPFVGFALFLVGLVPVVAGAVVLYGIWTTRPWGFSLGVAYVLLVVAVGLALPLLSGVSWADTGPAVVTNTVFLGYLYAKRASFRSEPRPGTA